MILIETINHLLWSGPLLFLLLGTHIFFTIKLHFPQLHTLKAIKISISPESNSKKQEPKMSGFATLATTLAATLGTGNIIGVSTAIALGGPGAMFWCWITGILGMATAYAECYLSVYYQQKNSNGTMVGGPMYVLEKGLHSKFAGNIYAYCTLFAAFGIGCSVQSNSIKEAIHTLSPVSPHTIGIIISILTGLVIMGGIKSISRFCMKVIPFLGFLYIFCCITLLWLNREVVLQSISLIIHSAFHPSCAIAGLTGGTLQNTIRFGIARGLFTNEAGIGTAAIAAGASDMKDPTKQGLISMTAVFWDTVVICALTGIVIVSNILKNPESVIHVNDAGLTAAAFQALPFKGNLILTLILIAFALTTIIGWSYFGETATIYLFGHNKLTIYHAVYLIMIYIGAIIPLNIVWSFTDFINGIMIFPNLLALWFLNRQIKNPCFINTKKRNV